MLSNNWGEEEEGRACMRGDSEKKINTDGKWVLFASHSSSHDVCQIIWHFQYYTGLHLHFHSAITSFLISNISILIYDVSFDLFLQCFLNQSERVCWIVTGIFHHIKNQNQAPFKRILLFWHKIHHCWVVLAWSVERRQQYWAGKLQRRKLPLNIGSRKLNIQALT